MMSAAEHQGAVSLHELIEQTKGFRKRPQAALVSALSAESTRPASPLGAAMFGAVIGLGQQWMRAPDLVDLDGGLEALERLLTFALTSGSARPEPG